MGLANRIAKMIAKNRPIKLSNNYIQSGSDFQAKTAFIIGGGSGIGFSIAKELKNNGANVIICGRKNYEYEDFESIILDVSQIDKLTQKLDELTTSRVIDIVVNSQGICPSHNTKKDFYLIEQKEFDEVMKVNLESVYFISQYFCKYFEKNGIKGNILNICSTEGLKGGVVPYGISKAAVISFTEGIGKIMASKGIVINGIAPGATATKMMLMEENNNLRLNYLPSERATTPTEVSKLAHFLLSDSGKQMCGQIVTIDGGESLH